MTQFSMGRVQPVGQNVHDHSSAATGGDTLDPTLVQVSQSLTVGNSIAGTGLQTDLSNDGSIVAGLSVLAPLLDLQAAVSVSATGTKDNYAPGSAWGFVGVVRFTLTGALTIRGLDAAPGGITFGQSVVVLCNLDTALTITLKHQNTNSSAANRLICPNGADYVIPPNGAAILYRDTQTQRWRVLAIGSSSSLADHAHTATGDGGALVSAPQLDVAGIEFAPSVNNLGAIITAQNDVAIGSVRIVQAAPSGANRAINGMVKTADYQFVTISNTDTTNALNINNENTNSSAANRFLCPGAVTYVLGPGASVEVYYDPTASRWRVVGH